MSESHFFSYFGAAAIYKYKDKFSSTNKILYNKKSMLLDYK